MTTVYNDYYKNVDNGRINVASVSFSVYIVDETYVPDPIHKKTQVTGKLKTFTNLIDDDAIITLSMNEIVEIVKAKVNLLDEEMKKKGRYMVVYDIATQELCFCEPLIDMQWQ